MHRNITHNKTYATCAQFAEVTLEFLREKVPRNWPKFSCAITDNFKVIDPKKFRIME
jgi:hypothetical protein